MSETFSQRAWRPIESPDETLSAEIRAELERILAHPLFGHSKRYPAFLRYVVEQTLVGRQDDLKERTVGIEALGRPSSYDTAQDPVVRTTAAEVRKRLAQYYQQAPDSQVHISLPVGSYAAQFEVPAVREQVEVEPLSAAAPPADARRGWTIGQVFAAAVVVLAVAGAILVWMMRATPSPLERFWSPLLAQNGPIIVCVGAVTTVNAPDAGNLFTINATTTASRIAGILQHHGKQSELVSVDAIDFADLRARATILVGGRNNEWTMRMSNPLRFHFVGTAAAELRIVDSVAGTQWAQKADRTTTPTTVFEDYAIVARVHDPSSGQHVVIAGGLGRYGTSAAGEFLTKAEHLERLAATAPAGWEQMNIELVIHTTLTDGVPGPPRVVASHFWK